MSGDEVGLDRSALLSGLGEEVNMHLVGSAFGAFMAEMGEIERRGIVLGLPEGERHPSAVIVATDEYVVGPGQCRAANQGIDAMQVASPRGPTPIMKGMMERGFGAYQRRLVGRSHLGRFGFDFAHPHTIPAR